MPTLEDVLNAPYDYDNDLVVTLTYNEQGHHQGFQFANYSSSEGFPSTWEEGHKGWATPDINTMLTSWGYRPVIKRTNEQPFDPCWDYRLMVPPWSTFRLWLYVFYDHEEVKKGKAHDEEVACMRIMEKVGNLATICPIRHEVHVWAEEQYKIHRSHPNREVKYLYLGLVDVLEQYAKWAGEKANG